MDTFPDLGSLTDQELKDLIKELTDEEREVSYRRRILHGQIDILRAELVNRLRKKDESGELVITGADVQQLTDILAGRASEAAGDAARGCRTRRARLSAASCACALPERQGRDAVAQHCPECGFANADGANYCQRCGAYLAGLDPTAATTASYRIGDTGELEELVLEDVVSHGAAIVIRAGGGRAGETFPLDGDRVTVGRRPDSDVFLDDVTVSRDHAVIVRRGGDYYLDDCGSLNGTYVNRERIESHRLARRRRAADRQIQARVPESLMSVPEAQDHTVRRGRGSRPGDAVRARRR